MLSPVPRSGDQKSVRPGETGQSVFLASRSSLLKTFGKMSCGCPGCHLRSHQGEGWAARSAAAPVEGGTLTPTASGPRQHLCKSVQILRIPGSLSSCNSGPPGKAAFNHNQTKVGLEEAKGSWILPFIQKRGTGLSMTHCLICPGLQGFWGHGRDFWCYNRDSPGQSGKVGLP